MTGKPHTPIYTRNDLAELVNRHDREHPHHHNNCECESGLVAMLRIYFAPTELIITDEPAPYIPPDLEPRQNPEKTSQRRPWLKHREGETPADYDHRISHSCYNCGTFIEDRDELNQHEDHCSQQGRRTTQERVK